MTRYPCPQMTLGGPVSFNGVGLHSGCQVAMTIHPAPPGTGIVFRRSDLDGFPIEATAAHIANVSYATTLMKKGVLVSTVEHVLSALRGYGVDNAFIDVDDMEVPILDGSAVPLLDAFDRVGLATQPAPRRTLRILREVHHELGDKLITASPSDRLEVTYLIDFPHPLIGRMERTYVPTPDVYRRELAPCRTFGFIREISQLKENGLIKGGSLDNAVVFSDTAVLNPGGLRFPDEFIRHKVLDFLGDLALVGMPVIGRFFAARAGHGIHAALVRKILANPANATIETDSSDAPPVTFRPPAVDLRAPALQPAP
ncbi:MAG: UDP-3-O-acyl-N-acetylglucosamine deacetylase [Acidobacteria bacterium]|nr:UDP-3-O-acyl-N-acetylglucosamine deacetylase [Acidobacteriota bacterium]